VYNIEYSTVQKAWIRVQGAGLTDESPAGVVRGDGDAAGGTLAHLLCPGVHAAGAEHVTVGADDGLADLHTEEGHHQNISPYTNHHAITIIITILHLNMQHIQTYMLISCKIGQSSTWLFIFLLGSDLL